MLGIEHLGSRRYYAQAGAWRKIEFLSKRAAFAFISPMRMTAGVRIRGSLASRPPAARGAWRWA